MPMYTIFRLKDHQKAHFRQLPHVSGVAKIKARDYEEPVESVEALTPYAAWFQMQEQGSPLEVGDVLVDETGAARVVKFVGVEPAEWFVPEAKPELVQAAAVAS